MGYTPGVYLLISLLMSKLPDKLLIKCPHNLSCKHSCNTRYPFRSQKPGFGETYENAGGVDSFLMFLPLIEALFSTFESETVGFPKATIGSKQVCSTGWYIRCVAEGTIRLSRSLAHKQTG